MVRQFLRLLLSLIAIALVLLVPLGAGWYLLHNQGAPSAGPAATASNPNRSGGGDILGGLLSRFQAADLNERASDDPAEVTFVVEPGDTAQSVSRRLNGDGLVRNPDSFRAALRAQGVDKRLEAGTYKLRRNMTVGEIIEALQHGLAEGIQVTIPEGRRAEEVAAILESAGVAPGQDLARLLRTGMSAYYPVLQDKPAGASLEGYLFPDTYQIGKDWLAPQVVDLLVKNMDQHFTPEMRQQAAAEKLTIHQVLTLASIVEREAKLDRERPIIAGVYLNRLAQGMKLDADPTIQYAMGYDDKSQKWWRSLLIDDLSFDSPYNTYSHVGLPPGPICNPGLASIQAVLQPAKTDYLYFVANAVAGDGSHVFARTFEEHQRNIAQYGAQ